MTQFDSHDPSPSTNPRTPQRNANTRLWHLKRLGADEFDEQWEPFHHCVGHNPADLQPFHSMFADWDAERSAADADRPPGMKTYYTNGDLYDLLRPDRADLPYMYDNFAWPHCSVSVRSGTGRVFGFRLFVFHPPGSGSCEARPPFG